MRESPPNQYIDLSLFRENYNLLEKAYLLHWLLSKRGVLRQEVIQKYLPLLGCESHETVLDYHLELLNLEKSLAYWALEFSLPIKIGVRLSRLSKTNQKALSQLPEKLSLNGNQFKNIFENLEELCIKEKKDMAQLIYELLGAENFEEMLIEKRYPSLKAMQNTWNAHKKKINFPSGVRLKDPSTFEESSVQIEMKIRSVRDLKNKLTQLSILTQKKDLDDILNLL